MLYLIYGTDTHKSRKKLHELLEQAKKRRPNAELFKINNGNWNSAKFEELLVSQGLFEQKYTVVLDNLFEKKDSKDFILDKIKEMAESEQVFLMLEGAVDSTNLKKIKKYAKQVQEFKKAEKVKSESNIFSITDGLTERNKKNLWVDFISFLLKGVGLEEIHGIFFWQVKNMLLASLEGSQKETGLSPFVYKNALKGARNYKTEELKNMSSELVDMTHKVRTGKGELGVMLEKWVLSR